MTRIISILFLSLQLLTSTELCQLLKLPVLFEHFREHGEFYQDFSLLGFLREHYFTGDQKSGDYDRDMQLPFKSNAEGLLIGNTMPIMVPVQIGLQKLPVTPVRIPFHRYALAHSPATVTPDIFQPPRFSRT